MKRSRINQVIKDMEALIREHGFEMPPFAGWTCGDWEKAGHEYDEIRDNKLGWDITDFGLGKFDEVGFSLFTIRNGNQKMPEKYKKPYAEKLLMLYEGQSITITPYMYHDFIVPKTGGPVLLGEVFMCNDDENDNFFYDKAVGRFPAIEEDEPPYRLLCTEYPQAK